MTLYSFWEYFLLFQIVTLYKVFRDAITGEGICRAYISSNRLFDCHFF